MMLATLDRFIERSRGQWIRYRCKTQTEREQFEATVRARAKAKGYSVICKHYDVEYAEDDPDRDDRPYEIHFKAGAKRGPK